MALTYTPDVPYGTLLKHFELPTLEGTLFQSQSLSGAPAQVYAFICGHCPYVQAVEDRLIQLALDLKKKNIPFVAICSNDPTEYPEDAPQALLRRAQEKKYSFPYLIDESQTVAKSFGAVCTPDFFIYDRNQRLQYRGRLDDAWKNSERVTRRELFQAATAIATDQKIPVDQSPSLGCSIKWRDE